jgi:hypothetical protein
LGRSGLARRFVFSSSRVGLSSLLLFPDRMGPVVGLRGIRCGEPGCGAADEGVCACERRSARAGVDARRALGEMPQRHGRDANATSRSRRGGGRARRGCGAGKAEARLGSVHARARVLVSQGRGVAVPCAGRRHPGPAARRGGGEATAVAGKRAARRAPARKDGTAAGGGWGPTAGYGLLTGGPWLTPAAGERRGVGGGAAHRRG